MVKLYICSPDENWIVDRFSSEWKEFNNLSYTNKILESDIVWIIAPWVWKKIPLDILEKKTVVATIHHIDQEKFKSHEKNDFFELDKYVDFYHSISLKTVEVLKSYTNKHIEFIPFWVNQHNFFPMERKTLKDEFKFEENLKLIGSFQRDTEGKSFFKKKPKLSKGPDQFLEIVKKLKENNENILVILAGPRRGYLKKQLKLNNIKYRHFKDASIEGINKLYNILDLYIVASRVEGGPAAIFECAASKTPIISTEVGIANEILHPDSIFDMDNFMDAKPDIDFAYENVKKYFINDGFLPFIKFFERVYEN